MRQEKADCGLFCMYELVHDRYSQHRFCYNIFFLMSQYIFLDVAFSVVYLFSHESEINVIALMHVHVIQASLTTKPRFEIVKLQFLHN